MACSGAFHIWGVKTPLRLRIFVDFHAEKLRGSLPAQA